jgi:hypothetical protein
LTPRTAGQESSQLRSCFRAGVPLVDVQPVQFVAGCVVPEWSPEAGLCDGWGRDAVRPGILVAVHDDDDDEDRARRRLFQEAVPGAVLGAAGARIGGPEGAALAGVLLPYGVDFFGKVLAEFGQDAQRRAGDMMGSAAEALDCGPDELAEKAVESERARLLTTTATFGAAQTVWPPRVRALGRALAEGLIAQDEDKIYLIDMALAAMTEMERPHVVLLELLACYVPILVEDRWTTTPYSPEPNPQGEPRQPDGRAWQTRAILAARPQLTPAIRGLIETLVRHGLIYERDRTTEAFRRYSTSLVSYQRRLAQRTQRGGPGLPDSPGIPDAPPRWSPTPFGEQVLNYYREAGAEEQQASSGESKFV